MTTQVTKLIDEVATWPGVTVEPHRFGGSEFKLDAVEIGHIHSNGLVDIPFTQRIRDQLTSESLAEPHHILPDTGWISFYMHRDSDLDRALWLLRLSYLHKSRSRNRRNTERIKSIKSELDSLGMSDQLRAEVG